MSAPVHVRSFRRPPAPQRSIAAPFDILGTFQGMMKEVREMYAEFKKGLGQLQEIAGKIESIKEGSPGAPGAPGKDAAAYFSDADVERAVAKFYKPPKDGQSPRPDDVAHALLNNAKFKKLLRKRIRPGKDGKDAVFPEMQEIAAAVIAIILETGLPIDAIKGLGNEFAAVRNAAALGSSQPYKPSPGNARGGGDTVVAGNGVSITETQNGTKQISVNAPGISIETPTGTVNGVNTVFTPTAQPAYVVGDGVQYFEGAGYSWDGTHVTLDVPPSQYIRAAIS